MKLSKEPIVGRGQELIQKVLAAHGIPFTIETDRIKFALRPEDHDPSVHAEISRDGGWVDFGDSSKACKGDAFDLIARLGGLDRKKDFNTIVETAYQLLDIPLPTKTAKEAPITTKEDLAARYGLEASDFASAGVTVGKKWVSDLKAEVECVIYPLQSQTGSAVHKWKTFERNAKGKRMVGADKGANLAVCLFGQPVEEARGKTLILNGGEEKCLATIKANIAGSISVSAPVGEKIKPALAKWIGSIHPSRVVITFDNDKAGRDGTIAATRLLRAEGIEDIRTVIWSKSAKDGEDLNDVLKAGGPTGLRAMIESAKAIEKENADGVPVELICSDTANSIRFVKKYGEKVLYDSERHLWMTYNGKHWEADIGRSFVRHASTTISHVILEEASTNTLLSSELTKWANSTAMSNRMNSMLEVAQSHPEMVTKTKDYDANDTHFNVLNGTLDIHTGLLKPHDRRDRITKIASVPYDPDAKCPTWEAFLHKSFGGNRAIIEFMQRAIGYSMTAITREQCMFILHGAGANGKSTFLETLRWLFGNYATAGEPKTFLADDQAGNAASARPDLVKLVGSRFVTLTEIDKGRRLDEATVKALTGQDSRIIRDLYSGAFEWTPTMKLFLATNHKPDVRGADEGIWRRIHLIPFEVIIPVEERDGDLPQKLRAEGAGILRWAVEGAKQWFATGLRPPDAVRAATREYREESDTLAPFLQECCFVEKNATETCSVVFMAYTEWCRRANETPMKQRAFGMAIKERGFGTKKGGKGHRWYTGLRLLDPKETPQTPSPNDGGSMGGTSRQVAEGGRTTFQSATQPQTQSDQEFMALGGRCGRRNEEIPSTRAGAHTHTHAHAHTHAHTRESISSEVLPLLPPGDVTSMESVDFLGGRTEHQSATHLPPSNDLPPSRPPWPQYGWHPDTPLNPTDSKDSSRDN